MPSNFACIGLSLTNAEELNAFVSEVAASLVEESRQGAERHVRWTDPSGASLALHLERETVACVTPFFQPPAGLARWTVTTSAARDDSVCAHCGGADCDLLSNGEMVTRSTVQWLHFRPFRKWLGSKRTYELEVAAFAQRVDVFSDEAAFSKGSLPGFGELKMAPNFFMPYGMFGQGTDVGASARVSLAGRVARAELRRNTRGGDFWWLRLVGLPGEVDIVAPAEVLASPPHEGAIAFVDAWLVGRPVEPPPRASWLQRLTGRF